MVEKRAPHARLKALGGAAGVVVVVLVIAGVVGQLQGSGSSSVLPAVKLTAVFPSVQTVGDPFTVVLHATSASDGLSDAVLDLSGCSDHWVVDTVSAGTGDIHPNGQQYDIGAISAGTSTDVTATFAPKDAGSHTCDMSLYQGDGSGSTTGSSLYDATVTSAINP